jgi:hypothetical protein
MARPDTADRLGVKASCPVDRGLLFFRTVGLPCAAIGFPFFHPIIYGASADLQSPRIKPDSDQARPGADALWAVRVGSGLISWHGIGGGDDVRVASAPSRRRS